MRRIDVGPGLKAAGLLLLSLLLAIAVDFVAPKVESACYALSFASACANGVPDEEMVARSSEGEIPDWLACELFVPQRAYSRRCSGGGSVVGFDIDGSAEDVFAELSKGLCEGGWLMVESGIAGHATFCKEDGICRWTMLSCVGVDGSTSVVMQSVLLGNDERSDA